CKPCDPKTDPNECKPCDPKTDPNECKPCDPKTDPNECKPCDPPKVIKDDTCVDSDPFPDYFKIMIIFGCTIPPLIIASLFPREPPTRFESNKQSEPKPEQEPGKSSQISIEINGGLEK
ncbi:MAG: hypothetical protein OEM21_10440, partial [Nitrosopumilus sp.]|nr:hypothetical protein [Nitrosopumilus sp.]